MKDLLNWEVSLDEFPAHLRSIRKNDWDLIFDMLPNIASLRSANRDEEFYSVVDQTHKLIYALGLVPVFDWGSWKEAHPRLANPLFVYEDFAAIELCKMLTLICRADRFGNGMLAETFENGIMLRILTALKARVAAADL